MGFKTYSQNLGVRPERIEEDRACLELLVPISQQAAVDYVNDGAETNQVIIDVTRYTTTVGFTASVLPITPPACSATSA